MILPGCRAELDWHHTLLLNDDIHRSLRTVFDDGGRHSPSSGALHVAKDRCSVQEQNVCESRSHEIQAAGYGVGKP